MHLLLQDVNHQMLSVGNQTFTMHYILLTNAKERGHLKKLI
jgi:hypothetical protein